MIICGIYKITSPTKKIYIGKSIDILRRWQGYNSINCQNQTYLYNSLKKYGVKKHKFEIICQCDKSELNNLEKYYIALFQCFNSKYGLNLREGGDGGSTCSDETREKLRKTHSKVGEFKKGSSGFTGKHTKESKQKMSEKKKGKTTWMKGRKHTEEAKEKNRLAHNGKIASDETKKKLSEFHKKDWERRKLIGYKPKPLTSDQRLKLSQALKGKKKPPRTQEHIRNLTNAIIGRKFTDEHKINLSKALRGKKKPPRTIEHQEHLTASIRASKNKRIA